MNDTRPWHRNYRKSYTADDFPPFLLHDALFDTAARFPAAAAIRHRGGSLSYATYAASVRRVAGGLLAAGLQIGDRVALYLPNSPHYLVAFFAVLAAGGVVVNLSPLDVAVTLEKKVADSGARWIVAMDRAPLAGIAGGIAVRASIELILCRDDDFDEPRDSRAESPLNAPLRFSHMLAGVEIAPDRLFKGSVEELAVLQYTGGTTGSPKGAMLLHRNLSVVSSQLLEVLSYAALPMRPGKERIFLALPLFHIFAMLVGMMTSVRLAAEIVLRERFEAEDAIRTITQEKISMFSGVPTMFTAIVNHPAVAKADLGSLKFCNVGGAPIAEETARRFAVLTGVKITDAWGMTEASGLATMAPLAAPLRSGSCGIPVPGVDLRIADLEDPAVDAPLGEPGELCIRGANLLAGYWQQPEATAQAFTKDGYFRTGDVGRMDADGYIRIVDRTKDMLLCSGYNVYPRIIEEAIYEHPDVEEVSVIGIDDPYRGQSPKAFIKMRAGRSPVEFSVLKEFLRDRLGRHEMISAMEVRAELPRTAVGKLSKLALIAQENENGPQPNTTPSPSNPSRPALGPTKTLASPASNTDCRSAPR